MPTDNTSVNLETEMEKINPSFGENPLRDKPHQSVTQTNEPEQLVFQSEVITPREVETEAPIRSHEKTKVRTTIIETDEITEQDEEEDTSRTHIFSHLIQ